MKQTTIKRKKIRIETSKIAFACAFGLTTLLLYVFFCIVPIFDSLVTSFFDWNGFGSKDFIGFENYTEIFKDPVFRKAIVNDLIITAGKEIVIVALTVLFAVSLTRLRFSKVETAVYKFVYYIPNVLSTIIIGTIWSFILAPNTGLLNGILSNIGLGSLIPKDGWIVEYPLQVITFVASWCGIGLFMIVMVAAINGVPEELYEASRVDGAGEWSQLWHITMPAVWKQVTFMVVTILYQSLGGNFGIVLTLAPSGGVSGSAMVMGLYVYNTGLDSYIPRVGYSYAGAVIMLIVTSAATLFANWIMSKMEKED